MVEARRIWEARFKLLTHAASLSVSVCDLRVLANLLERFNPKHGECWPSIATIASDLDISTRQASRSVVRLEDLGLVDVLRVDGKSSLYTPSFDVIELDMTSLPPGA